MNGAAEGILMLTCQLGDEMTTPLTPRQFHSLRIRAAEMRRPGAEEELTDSHLQKLGLPAGSAGNIVWLLSRQNQLENYLARAARCGITVLTRLDGA